MEWYWILLVLSILYIVFNNTLVLKDFAKKYNWYIDLNKEEHKNIYEKIIELENEIKKLKKDALNLQNIVKNEDKSVETYYDSTINIGYKEVKNV